MAEVVWLLLRILFLPHLIRLILLLLLALLLAYWLAGYLERASVAKRSEAAVVPFSFHSSAGSLKGNSSSIVYMH